MESLDGLKQPGSDCARRHRDDSGPERRGSGRVRPTQHFYMHSPRTHAHATQHTHRTHTLHSYHIQHTRTTYIHAHRQRSRHTRTLAWAHAQTRRKHHRAARRGVRSRAGRTPLPILLGRATSGEYHAAAAGGTAPLRRAANPRVGAPTYGRDTWCPALARYVATTGESTNIVDAYDDPRFSKVCVPARPQIPGCTPAEHAGTPHTVDYPPTRWP